MTKWLPIFLNSQCGFRFKLLIMFRWCMSCSPHREIDNKENKIQWYTNKYANMMSLFNPLESKHSRLNYILLRKENSTQAKWTHWPMTVNSTFYKTKRENDNVLNGKITVKQHFAGCYRKWGFFSLSLFIFGHFLKMMAIDCEIRFVFRRNILV